MPHLSLDHVLQLEHEFKAPPPTYSPPEYSVEPAPPAYTSTPVANDTSIPPYEEGLYSFRRNNLEPQLSLRDKGSAWRRAITRRYCGVPGWIILILVAVGVVVGAAVASRVKKGKEDLLRSDRWYTFDATGTYGQQSHLYADTNSTSNKVRLLADDQMQNDKTAGHWQVRKLENYNPYKESCKQGLGKDDITLYGIRNHFTGPKKYLGFKEKLFTQKEVRDSGNETLVLDLSDDPANKRSQMWYAEKKGDGYNGDITPFRLWNCVTKEDFVLGWQNTTSETGSNIVAPVMFFAAIQSKHMLWNIRDSGEINLTNGWQID